MIAVATILVCLMAGKVLHFFIGGLPASLYGLMFFSTLLASGLVNASAIGPVISRIIYYMPVVFLPVCVGVMQYESLIIDVGWKLLLVGVTTALLTMGFIAYITEKVLGPVSDP